MIELKTCLLNGPSFGISLNINGKNSIFCFMPNEFPYENKEECIIFLQDAIEKLVNNIYKD